MNLESPPEIIKLLAHDLRWRMMRHLAIGDYRVNELVALVKHPLNLVSYHLKQLREGGLVTVRRSEADGRDTYYSLDLDHLQALYRQAGRAIHPAVVGESQIAAPLTSKPRVLFVCTHNSARSQMAEGLLRHLSAGEIDVASAGSQPTRVHPDAIRTMDSLGIDIRAQRAKGFDVFLNHPFDTVITVCDHAREVCPTFPGESQHLHWGFPDPVSIEAESERQRAFMHTAQQLRSRIQHFLQELTAGEIH